MVAALQGLGIEIVVDDYGTGYSSLSYLRDLRTIAGLKLDRSFVTHLDSDPRAQAIVESTIALAALGCEYAQGYLFSRPLPAEALQLGVIESARAAR